MLDSVVIDIAIGVALTFFVVSAMVAAVNQWVTHLLQTRSKVLWKALANLLGGEGANDFTIGFFESLTGFARTDRRPSVSPTAEGDPAEIPALLTRLANSPLIAPLGGRRRVGADRTVVDHIPPSVFASALIDLAERGGRADLLTHLAQARAAHGRATAEVAPDPAEVIEGWRAARVPEQLEAAITEAGLPLSLANPLTASATAWRAATEDPPAAGAALALNEPLGTGIDALAAALDTELTTALVDLTAGTPIGAAVETSVRRAGGGLDRTLAEISSWFDTYMAQLSELYRVAARRMLFLAGLVLAVGLNVDALDLIDDLGDDADTRAALVAAADATSSCSGDDLVACAEEAREALAEESAAVTLPVFGDYVSPVDALGLADAEAEDHWSQVVAGWVITALAVSFGAPFWFDVLSRLGGYRRRAPGAAAER